MVLKTGLFVFFGTVALYAQSQIDISGTVLDNNTHRPIEGASVTLVGPEISGTTDTDGFFHITSTSAKGVFNDKRVSGTLLQKNHAFFFHNEAEGNVKISIYSLSGRLSSVLFSGLLKTGWWRFPHPSLPRGMYICRITTDKGVSAARFFSSQNQIITRRVEKRAPQQNAVYAAKAHAAKSVFDSLRITKEGYSEVVVSVYSMVYRGLEIFMTDTVSRSMATIIPDPSWTCFMPDGIPPPEQGERVFHITLSYTAIHDVGVTQFGYRRLFDIRSGDITGDRIDGSFLTGGLDLELTLTNGTVELEQICIFLADDTPVLMRNAGVASAGQPVRVVLDFEAPNASSLVWLNTGTFAGTRIVDTAAKTIEIDVYDISQVALTESQIQITDPVDVPDQTWECFSMSGTRGEMVFTENVTLGPSISIGASKRGNRNIIPITGGTTSGRVTGEILPGGADYQLSGLDARYTLASDDGELIIVRNCGPMGALVPVFEARADGPYAFLNEKKYLSSAPGIAGNGVSITFYESR